MGPQSAANEDASGIKQELDQLKREVGFQKELRGLQDDVHRLQFQLKWYAVTAALLAVVFTFFGYREYSSLRSLARNEISKFSETSYTMSRAFVLTQTNQFREALPFLTKLYSDDHYSDGVVRSLLLCLEVTGDWQTAYRVVDELRADPGRFYRMADSMTFVQVASVLIYRGITDPSSLEQAEQLLRHAERVIGSYDPMRGWALWNLARIELIRGNLQAAKIDAAGAASSLQRTFLKSDIEKESWFVRLKEKRFKEKRSNADRDLEAMLSSPVGSAPAQR